MFVSEKSIGGRFSPDKVWRYYAEVSLWKEWDASIRDVSLEGSFQTGTKGVMSMKDGQRISFLLDAVIENKSFTTHSQMGQIKISLIHELSDHSITHRIEISGAPNAQLEALGQAIGSNLEQALNSLAPLAKQ